MNNIHWDTRKYKPATNKYKVPTMLYDDSKETAACYLKQVVPKLVELNLPTNPVNYAIWYEYTTGRNQQLNKEIDELMAQTKQFSKEIARDLYYRHILAEDTAQITRANDVLKKTFLELIASIKILSEDNQEFIDLLVEQSELMHPEMDLETFNVEIKRTIEASYKAQNVNSQYHEKFLAKAKELEQLKSDFERVRKEANTDSLTQIGNRKAFNETLHGAILAAIQEKTPLCVAILDIDHFKHFNDTHGHLTGDQVLKYVAQMIKKNIKGKDFVARFGGEEFAVILPETPLKGAYHNSENIRNFIAKNKIVNRATKQPLANIYVSIGVAQYQHGEELQELLARADKALYKAKNAGRNQVISAPPST